MTPDKTIRRALLEYPSLFKTRADVLHHMFCVIGNGYEWRNGELIRVYDYITDDPTADAYKRVIDRLTYQLNDITRSIIGQKFAIHIADEYLTEIDEAKINIETRMVDYTYTGNLYPKCENYAYLWNYPDVAEMTGEWYTELTKALEIFIPLYNEMEVTNA